MSYRHVILLWSLLQFVGSYMLSYAIKVNEDAVPAVYQWRRLLCTHSFPLVRGGSLRFRPVIVTFVFLSFPWCSPIQEKDRRKILDSDIYPHCTDTWNAPHLFLLLAFFLPGYRQPSFVKLGIWPKSKAESQKELGRPLANTFTNLAYSTEMPEDITQSIPVPANKIGWVSPHTWIFIHAYKKNIPYKFSDPFKLCSTCAPHVL